MPNTSRADPHYVPALRYEWLTRFYDPVIALTTRERAFRQALIQQANLSAGAEVLDVGCGTGTLAIWMKNAFPQASITGLDGDPEILAIARRKTAATGVDIRLEYGLSFDIPFPDATFDRVLSSLLFHHLTRQNKERTLQEVFRVLKPGGELHIADWGKAANSLMRALFHVVQILDGFETTEENVQGVLPQFMANAGFKRVSVQREINTLFGTLALYSADKPG